MGLFSFYRISKPSKETVPEERVGGEYKRLRSQTFWGATAAYSLFYLCRLSMGVVKKPLIDEGLFSASELGIIASAFYFVYAIGKFLNGFIADYCNARRFMATGLLISSVINLLMGIMGLADGYVGLPGWLMYVVFVLLWGFNGWVLSMGSPSGIVSLSRWFPQSRRGTFYSIFCSTPYIGEALSMVLTGSVVAAFGWEYGFIVSMDDFGAGYSSLGVFEQIPASVVKLDRSFLLNQVDRERQVKIMRGIVKLSDELEAEVVCEGVETEKDIELMHEIGAFVEQGYFYSKPVPEEEFEQKLNAQEL